MHWSKIKKIHYTQVEEEVFNLTCAPTPTFFANDILVHNCAFCYPTVQKIFGSKVRYRSPRNVLDEIEQILVEYGNKVIRFHDDSQTVNGEWIKGFCQLIKQDNITFVWESKTRVNLVNRDLIKMMRKAGCVRLELGVESGSDRVRNDVLNKNISREQILDAFQICYEEDMETLAFFIIGSPTERPVEIQETIDLMKLIRTDRVQVSILNPLPSTAIYDKAAEMQLLLPCRPEDGDFHTAGIKNLYYSPQQLENLRETIEKGVTGHNMWMNWKILKRQFKNPIRLIYYLLWWFKLETNLLLGKVFKPS